MPNQIKNLLLIASGKGGVGKSTVAVNLALALARSGKRVGLLDADVYGPSIPTLLGKAGRPQSPDGKTIVPVERHGIKAISMGYLVDRDTAMMWRGPMLAGAVTQFVNDVAWGELDYLIFDLPPGTGDIQLTLAQKFQVTGALLVTTPQDVAMADVVRAKSMFDKTRVEVLGLIENMSFFVCSNCDARHEIFSHGGGARGAVAMNVPFLGAIPIEPGIGLAGDLGEALDERAPTSASWRAFVQLASRVETLIEEQAKRRGLEKKGRGALNIVRS